MTKLLILTLSALGLAGLSHATSWYERRDMRYVRREWLAYLMMAVVLVFFAGFRTRYNDTVFYLHAYQLLTPGPLLAQIDWRPGSSPLFQIVNQLLVNLGVGQQTFLLFYAALTVGIYLWFIRKYTSHIWLSIFLFLMAGTYTFTLAAVKQCMAVALCLVGTDRALRRRWDSFALWVLLGAGFHVYALVYLVVPLLCFRPWTGRTYVLWLGALAFGVLPQPLMGLVVQFTALLGEEYDATFFDGAGVHPLRLAVTAVPAVLAFMARKVIWQKDDRVADVLVNLAIFNAQLMLLALFGTANYIARFANYFHLFQCLALPLLLRCLDRPGRRLLMAAAVVCYAAYWIYDNLFNHRFDSLYSALTLGEYLRAVL